MITETPTLCSVSMTARVSQSATLAPGHPCASKAGLHGLCSAMAKEYGRKGITTNVVVPGYFETDMTRDGMSQSNREFWVQFCPVGRTGELREVAHTVMFLASEGASFINGQAISVTGGLDWAP